MAERLGGKIELSINGEVYLAKGSFKYNIGADKKTAIVGPDKVHGYKAMPQVSYIEGEITDRYNLNLRDLVEMKDATVTLYLANGKTIVQQEAWYAHDGEVETEEGNIQFRSEGISCDEVK